VRWVVSFGWPRGRRARSCAGVPRYHLACRRGPRRFRRGLPATARQPAV